MYKMSEKLLSWITKQHIQFSPTYDEYWSSDAHFFLIITNILNRFFAIGVLHQQYTVYYFSYFSSSFLNLHYWIYEHSVNNKFWFTIGILVLNLFIFIDRNKYCLYHFDLFLFHMWLVKFCSYDRAVLSNRDIPLTTCSAILLNLWIFRLTNLTNSFILLYLY